jgi:hypothetical protein
VIRSHFRELLSLSLDSTEVFVHPDDDVPFCGRLRELMEPVQRVQQRLAAGDHRVDVKAASAACRIAISVPPEKSRGTGLVPFRPNAQGSPERGSRLAIAFGCMLEELATQVRAGQRDDDRH